MKMIYLETQKIGSGAKPRETVYIATDYERKRIVEKKRLKYHLYPIKIYRKT